jgi:GTP-binding protein
VKLNQAKFVAAYGTIEQVPASVNPEIAFVGRSNVGKSSIMNRIFKRKGLVKVSSTPGKTTTINFFRMPQGNLAVDFIDLPGYGYAKVGGDDRKRWSSLIEGYFDQDRWFALAVVLVDIRHDVSDLDKQMVDYLVQRGIPFIIVFTKADKLSKQQRSRQVPTLCRQLGNADDAVVLACSSLKGTGVDDVRGLLSDAVAQARDRGNAPQPVE